MSVRVAPPMPSAADEKPRRPGHSAGADWIVIEPRPFVVAPRPRPRAQTRKPRVRRHPRIWATLAALAILLLANLAIQVNRRQWDVQADQYFARQRVQQCESLGRTPDVLYLGSSRTLFDIDPARVDSQMSSQTGVQTLGCNAGMFDATIEQDYYTLQRFVRDGHTPKLIVETLWESNLNIHAGSPADTDAYHFNHVLALADLRDTPTLIERMGGVPQGLPGIASFLAQRLIPLYGDRDALFRALCGTSTAGPCGVDTSPIGAGLRRFYQSSTRQGWIPQADIPLSALTPDQREQRMAGVNPIVVNDLRNFTIGGHQPDYLARMIALARQHGARFVLVQPPLRPQYYELFPHPDDWRHVTTFWSTFAAQHGVPYYDESHLPGYDEEDFVDLHHLQAAGAQKFSAWLAEHVVGPALAPSAS